MRTALLLVLLAACGKAADPPPEASPGPDAEVRRLAAPCLVRAGATAPVQVVAALAADGAPQVVKVTGTRDALLKACVAKAVKSVRFPKAGARLELELGPAPSDGE